MGSILFIRRKGSQDLQRVTAQPYHKIRTEADLHRFLEADPSLIARGISQGEPLPTTVVASHLKLLTGELDLLLVDAEGEVTIAELKRGRTPRDTVAQVLDYAAQVTSLGMHSLAELGADWDRAIDELSETGEAAGDLSLDTVKLKLHRPRLLVVAYEIDETTQRIAHFLRKAGVPIYCIEFQYFADDEQEYYYPEVLGAGEVADIGARTLTPTQRAYQVLWAGLLQRFNEEKPGVTRRSKGLTNSWLGLPIGLSNAHLEWAVHGLNRPKGWFEVGLHLEHSEGDKNLDGLEWLQQKQQKMEGIIGQPLHLEPWGKHWARAYARIDAPTVDEEVQDWALETMLRFYDALEQLDVVAQLRALGW